MSSWLREHFGAVFWSVALHAAVVAALAIGAGFARRPQPVELVAIEAVVVDETLLARADQQREEAERRRLEQERAREEAARREREAEEQRRLAAERAAEEQRRLEAEQAAEEARRQQEAEAARQAELERQREQARQEAERQRLAEEARRKEEAERQARLEEERRRQEEERRRQEEERRREQERQAQLRAEEERRRREEERLQRELDAELQREADRLAAVRSGALDEYRSMLKNRIEQNWLRPPSARPGINCTVHVTQIPSGEVISARVTRCNGDEAVVRSIEAAVLRASPLPLPSVPSLFERNLIIDFVPDE